MTVEQGLLGVGVGLSALAIDWTAARYTQAIQEKHPHQAAIASAALTVLGAINLYVFVTVSPFYIIPEIVGNYLGTYIAVDRDKNKPRLPRIDIRP